jgi:hypothetical protein
MHATIAQLLSTIMHCAPRHRVDNGHDHHHDHYRAAHRFMSHHAHVAYLCVVARASLHQVFHCDVVIVGTYFRVVVFAPPAHPPARPPARPRCSPLLCAAQGLRTTTRKMKTTMSSWRQPTSSAPYKRECRHRSLSACHFRNLLTHPRRCLIGHRQRVSVGVDVECGGFGSGCRSYRCCCCWYGSCGCCVACVMAAAVAARSVVGAWVGWWWEAFDSRPDTCVHATRCHKHPATLTDRCFIRWHCDEQTARRPADGNAAVVRGEGVPQVFEGQLERGRHVPLYWRRVGCHIPTQGSS